MFDQGTDRVTGFVMPVGNGAVGKTSLAFALENTTLPLDWADFIANIQKSYNLEFRYLADQIEVNGRNIKVLHQYLVPPGQKAVEVSNRGRSFEDVIRIYRSMIRRVDVVLFSYKITDLDTYHDIEFWLEKVAGIIHPRTTFILVGTHLDQNDQREVTDQIVKTGKSYIPSLMKTIQPAWNGVVTSMEVSNVSGENIAKLRKLISGAILLACGLQVNSRNPEKMASARAVISNNELTRNE